MAELKTHRVEVHLSDDIHVTHQAVAWWIGEPEGWLQIAEVKEVFFYPISTVMRVAVPNLPPEERGEAADGAEG
jgi:hypothetical protein